MFLLHPNRPLKLRKYDINHKTVVHHGDVRAMPQQAQSDPSVAIGACHLQRIRSQPVRTVQIHLPSHRMRRSQHPLRLTLHTGRSWQQGCGAPPPPYIRPR
jgi:hypothetical protein